MVEACSHRGMELGQARATPKTQAVDAQAHDILSWWHRAYINYRRTQRSLSELMSDDNLDELVKLSARLHAGLMKLQGGVPAKKTTDKEKIPITNVTNALALLPDRFSTKEFIETWMDFCTHRRAKRQPLTARAISMLTDDFIKWGVEVSIEAMR